MQAFTKDSVVCFFGDSITANGAWIRRIYDYYRLEQKIPCKLYNCGVPGDQASHALYRMEETVFCYEPTHVVVAFGMNDSGYYTYKEEPLTDTQVMNRRRWLDTSIAFLRSIAARCRARGAQVTFCTPTLPDELTESEVPVYYSISGALQELSLRIRALGQELDADVVDFNATFRKIGLKLYKEGKSLICPDRIHPLPEGHELMAKLFLKAQGFDVSVPDTWEELHQLAQLPHDEWENRRYQLECEANANMYVDWDFGFGKKAPEAMDEAIAKQFPLETRPHIQQRFKDYPINRPLIPERKKALMEFTNTI